MRTQLRLVVAALVGLPWVAALAVGSPPAPAQAANQVLIVDVDRSVMEWGFEPGTISVPVGATVSWRNDGAQAHDVTAGDGSFRSPMLKSTETWQFTFTTPGEFPYQCSPHPWMTGVVRVLGAPAPASPAPEDVPREGPAEPAAPAQAPPTPEAAPPPAPTPASEPSRAAPRAPSAGAAEGDDSGATPAPPNAAPEVVPDEEPTVAAPEGDETAAQRSGRDSGDTNTAAAAFAILSTLAVMAIGIKLLLAKP